MGNMSYCRFQNTLADLRDCFDNMEEEVSAEEHRARKALIHAAHQIASRYDDGDDLPTTE